MTVIKIKEDTMLVSLTSDEADCRFFGIDSGVCDREGRIRLRELLCESCEQAGVKLSDSSFIEVFGTVKSGFHIFVSPSSKAYT